MTNPNLTGKHARWALSLQDLQFTVQHRPGTCNANAAALSRSPVASSVDVTGARLDEDPVTSSDPADVNALLHSAAARAVLHELAARQPPVALLGYSMPSLDDMLTGYAGHHADADDVPPEDSSDSLTPQ